MLPLLARAILASRYLPAAFFLGLAVALGLPAVRFGVKLRALGTGRWAPVRPACRKTTA